MSSNVPDDRLDTRLLRMIAVILIGGLLGILNSTMAAVATDTRAIFANPFPVFNPQGDQSAETAAICELTLICTQGDTHPSDAGYRAIAGVVWTASGYSRLS